MARPKTLNPRHAAIKNYYKTLDELRAQNVENESALRPAFQNLLAESARLHGWTLIPELSTESRGRTVIPDGTVRDANYLPRGYWEAKDTADDLQAEIRKKIDRGYPASNIIFEDTQQAILYQDKREVLRADLTDALQLVDLVNQFHNHVEPEIETFEKAIEEFKDRVPGLGAGLKEKIKDAHRDNPRFEAAFEEFYELCRKSLNPNLSREAVDEMLIQHLLTERLFRTVFEDADFTRRNVIAAQVENVIDALVSQSFSRREYLRALDRFYVAIEDAARNLPDFSDKTPCAPASKRCSRRNSVSYLVPSKGSSSTTHRDRIKDLMYAQGTKYHSREDPQRQPLCYCVPSKEVGLCSYKFFVLLGYQCRNFGDRYVRKLFRLQLM